jgi:succinoglycan biosynthesis transport protein ExoP
MEIIHLFKALLRRKWIVLLCVLVAVATAFLLTRNERKEYRSTTQVFTGFTVNDEVKMSEDRFNLPQIEVKFNNVIENFNSPKVLSLVSYDLMLHDLTEQTPFKSLSRDDQKNSILVKNINRVNAARLLTEKLEKLHPLNANIEAENQLLNYIKLYRYDVESLKRNLQVQRVPRTDYINISFISENPDLSAFVVNTIVTKFETYYNDSRKQRSDTSISNLDSLVRQKKVELDNKIAAKTEFMSTKGILDVNMEGSSKLQQISSIESQLADEKSKSKDLNYRVKQLTLFINEAKAKKPTNAVSISTADNELYLALKTQYNSQYREYIRTGSADAALKKSLEDIKKKIRLLEPSGADLDVTISDAASDDLVQKRMDADAQLKATVTKIGLLQNMLGQLQGNFNGMASKGAGLEQLEREIQLSSAEYTKAKEKLNAALNISEAGSSTFKQTLYGQPALQPEPTHRSMKLALSAVCAFVLSSLIIILLEFIDTSIKTPSQFQKITKLRLLGAINHASINSNLLRSVGKARADEKDRNDTFRELLRKVRYEIEHSGKKVFLFTSTEPRQGKTTLIQALAYSLSLMKKKVLIIDTNFCNNDLTAMLHARPVLEAINIERGKFRPEDVTEYISPTEVPGVDLIGCSGGNYTPSEILPVNHLLNHLDGLSGMYDFIFMEGAPLNDFTDTKELIHYADGVIGIFSASAKISATDNESIRFLKQHDHKFLGAVLNKVKPYHLDV